MPYMLKFFYTDIISPNKMRGNFLVFKYAVAPLKVHVNDNVFSHFLVLGAGCSILRSQIFQVLASVAWWVYYCVVSAGAGPGMGRGVVYFFKPVVVECWRVSTSVDSPK